MNANIYSRILELSRISGDTMYSLSKHSGVSESVLSRMKSNPTGRVSKKNLILLANYFCVNLDWLETGEGDKDAAGVVKDSVIYDDALYKRFVEVSQALFGDEEDNTNGVFRNVSVSCELMSTYTNIPIERIYNIIYDNHFPTYTEVISLLKSDKSINANWLFIGVEKMFKSSSPVKESGRISTLVDTIATLQDSINAKTETIAALNERIRQLENQLNK